jgi:hypothetical protein
MYRMASVLRSRIGPNRPSRKSDDSIVTCRPSTGHSSLEGRELEASAYHRPAGTAHRTVVCHSVRSTNVQRSWPALVGPLVAIDLVDHLAVFSSGQRIVPVAVVSPDVAHTELRHDSAA